MSRGPRVSVAIATHDGEAYLGEQLASILGQTVPVDEIVVSDDASRDGTVALARGALSEVSIDVVVLQNDPALGVAANFESALSAATGEVVLLSDQDDVWAPDRVARTLAAFAADPRLLAVHGDARLVDRAGVPMGMDLLEALDAGPDLLARIHAGDAFPQLLRRNLATGATMAIRRELLDRARPFPVDWVHDEWLAIIAAALGGLDVIETPLIDYRQHGGNQIGVEAATMARKIRRVLEPRGTRNAGLARRAAVLTERLEALPGVPREVIAAARGKLAFEAYRAAMPAVRLARLPAVLGALRRGDYRRFASRGNADVVRDLLQPV